MSSGTWSVYFDSYNNASKTWSGANGKKTENAYTMTHHLYKGTKSQFYYNGGYQGDTYRNPPMSIASTLRDWGQEEAQAYSKLAEKVKGSGFSAQVFFGTMHQTATMIANNALKVLTAARAFKRGDFAGGVRALGQFRRGGPTVTNRNPNFQNSKKRTEGLHKEKLRTDDISGALLEFRYGVQPLMQDVFEGLQALDSLLNDQQVVVRSKAWSGSEFVGDAKGNLGTSRNDVWLKAIFREVPTALQVLNMTDPSTLAWELLPWSFVIDWFIPVGQYLESRSVLSSLNFRVVKSTKRQTLFVRSSYVETMPPSYLWIGGAFSYETTEFIRSIIENPSVPAPSFKTLAKALGREHLQNAAALINSSLFPDRKKRISYNIAKRAYKNRNIYTE